MNTGEYNCSNGPDCNIVGCMNDHPEPKVGDEVLVLAFGSAKIIAIGTHDNGTEGMVAVQELLGMDGTPGPRIEIVPESFINSPLCAIVPSEWIAEIDRARYEQENNK